MCGYAVLVGGVGECVEHGCSGDASMDGAVQGVTGMIIKPTDNFSVGPIGQRLVGEIRLPAFIG